MNNAALSIAESFAEYHQKVIASAFSALETDTKAIERQRSKEDVQRKRRGRDQFGRKIPR